MINGIITQIKREDNTKIVIHYSIHDIQAYYDKFNESVGQLDLVERGYSLEYIRPVSQIKLCKRS